MDQTGNSKNWCKKFERMGDKLEESMGVGDKGAMNRNMLLVF